MRLWSTFPFEHHQCHRKSSIWETSRKVHVGSFKILYVWNFLVRYALVAKKTTSRTAIKVTLLSKLSVVLLYFAGRSCKMANIQLLHAFAGELTINHNDEAFVQQAFFACCCIQGTAAWSWAWKGPSSRWGEDQKNEGCDSEFGESPNIDSPLVTSHDIEHSR